MGCLLWVCSLIYVLLLSSQCCMSYHDKLDHIITALDCSQNCTSWWPSTVLSFQDERRVWVEYQKKKWALQKQQREARKRRRLDNGSETSGGGVVRTGPTTGLGSFLRRTARTMMDLPWQIVQVVILPDHYCTPRFNEVERGVYWFHLVRLWTESCLQKVCCV